MAYSRTRFFPALLSALWLLPFVARAGDVTVDYSQLEPQASADVVPLFTPQLSTAKAPIHLHPLVAITSPTVKNLVAEVAKPEIHLHPPAPMALANIAPVPVSVAAQTPTTPITKIDLSLAAVPVAPKPAEITATAAPIKTADVTAAAAAPAAVPQPNVDIAFDKAAVPVKPKEEIVPPPAETTLADTAPAAPVPEPKKSPDDNAPPGFVRVNAAPNKTDELTPEDVVGLDFGTPEKPTNN